MLLTPASIFTLLLGISVLSLVGCIALGIFCYRLLVDRGRLLLRLERMHREPARTHSGGLAAGAYLSDVALPRLPADAEGGPGAAVAVSHLVTSCDQPQILMFLDSACLYSRALARELRDHAPGPEAPGIIAVIGGDAPGSAAFPRFPGTLLHDPDRTAALIYGVAASPAGYRVAPTRHTVGRLLVGPAALLHAIHRAGTTEHHRQDLPATPIPRDPTRHMPPLAAGDPAPEIHPPGSPNASRSLARHWGQPLTLLFVDPDCPPCHGALEMLARCPGGIVTIISRGTPEESINMRAAALPGVQVLLQPQREAALAFRLMETPTLYEIDAAGTISSGPITGLAAITSHLAGVRCGHASRTTAAP